MQIKISGSAQSRGLLHRVLTLIVTASVIVLAVMFSAVFLVIILVAATLGGIYLWWKTRELRKQMRNFTPPNAAMNMNREQRDFKQENSEQESFKGEIIEGEVVYVDESKDQR